MIFQNSEGSCPLGVLNELLENFREENNKELKSASPCGNVTVHSSIITRIIRTKLVRLGAQVLGLLEHAQLFQYRWINGGEQNRTYATSLLIAAGLFPPSEEYEIWNEELLWQPVPVHENPQLGTVSLKTQEGKRF